MSKYHAQPTTVDNVRFDSKAEARRYGELKLLQKAGYIRGLMLQPHFTLHAPTAGDVTLLPIGDYVADFQFSERIGEPGVEPELWRKVIEDVKGYGTALYGWKKRHFEIEYAPLKITEIRGAGRG